MKHFVNKLLLFLLVCIPIAITYYLPSIYIIPYQTGDLGRLGGIPFGAYDTIFHRVGFNYVQNIDNFDSLQNADIITIGDSFSQQNIEGYQNYLGHSINHIVYNFRIQDGKPENTAYTLIKKGMIPNCKILIVESIERAFIKSSSNDFQIIDNILDKQIRTTKISKIKNDGSEHISKFNQFSLTLQKLSKYYKTKLSLVKNFQLLQLKEEMFTSLKYSKSLYLYNHKETDDGDLRFQNISSEILTLARNNINTLINAALSNNIKIIYLIPADKYDMYYDYIEDNPYPRNPSFDYFKDYDTTVFINTKKLLLPFLQQGAKDIYRVNDTHWSPIAAKIVGEHIASIINNNLDNKK